MEQIPQLNEIPAQWIFIREHREGGQGKILLYQKPGCDTLTAVKTFHKESFSLERFKRTLDILSRLKSPNIIQIEAHGQDPTHNYWYATPYHKKGSLAGKRFSEEAAAKIILKISLALDLAHNEAILHRDIKPENILLSDADEPILIDWDIGKVSDYSNVTIVGTLGFFPPDQLQEDYVDGSIDIFALGKTFKNIVAGLKQNHDLELLIKTMMHNNPCYRPTAKQVALELQRLQPFLSDTSGSVQSDLHRAMKTLYHEFVPVVKQALKATLSASAIGILVGVAMTKN